MKRPLLLPFQVDYRYEVGGESQGLSTRRFMTRAKAEMHAIEIKGLFGDIVDQNRLGPHVIAMAVAQEALDSLRITITDRRTGGVEVWTAPI